ncbi:hypothetical protein NM208_g3112 [Fusarium decemcellulare]|uniref:Uncharacterized protein n=1 Tax=Fusarium decemcellulare TaxID=57161 RepID=A0ACC1SQE0_9HYPO|nr:hypothetical protein NM208_g3112 [Fusarium decemcellulare]
MPALPIVDLRETSSPADLASRLMKVGENPGFFYLVGHGIPEELVTGMFNLSKDFFENCPAADRARFASNSGEPYKGYSGPAREKLSGLGRGDLKESYHFQSFKASPDVELPLCLDNNRSTLRRFSHECERLGNILLQAFSVGLKKPPAFLPAYHTGQQNRFRLLHYPPYVPGADGPSSPDEEDVRAVAHSDYGSLTLLFQEPTDQGGLQVWQNGDWVDVPYITDSIVVNIGDALEFWTACQLRSTIHRVTFPPGQAPPQSRFSIPFFVTADDETVLEPILPPSNNTTTQDSSKAFFGDIARVKGYLSLEPVTALEHRLRREATIGGSAAVAETTR